MRRYGRALFLLLVVSPFLLVVIAFIVVVARS